MDVRRLIRQVVAIILAAVTVLAITGFFVARSQAFHRFLLSKLIRQAEARTGANIGIRNMNIAWSSMTVNLSGLVVHGPEAGFPNPLLRVDHLLIRLRIAPLLRHQLILSGVVIDGPSVNLRVDANGHSNLPAVKATPSSNFTFAVQHLSIQNGMLSYNDQHIPLNAQLSDLRMQANFDPLIDGYQGILSYGRGWVLTEGLNRLEHAAKIDFKVTREQLVVQPLTVSTGKSRITLDATLDSFDHPRLAGRYDLVVDTRELGQILRSSAIPNGQMRFTGDVKYQTVPGQSSIQGIEIDGQAFSSDLRFRNRQIEARLTGVQGSYTLANGKVKIESLEASLLGGHTAASGQIGLADASPSELHMLVRDASLEQLSSFVPARDRQNARLAGRVNAELRINWVRGSQDLVLRAHLAANGPDQTALGSRTVPVNGVVDLTYDAARKSASFLPSHLRTGKTGLTLSGTASRHSDLTVTVDSTDLHELSSIISEIARSSPDKQSPNQSRPYDLDGTGRFKGQITGSIWEAWTIRGDISTNAFEVQGSKWKALRASIEVGPAKAEVRNGFLQDHGSGEINFNGNTTLRNWAFDPSRPISVQANWKRLSLAEMVRLARADYPVSGSLSGEVSIEGSEEHPRGHGSLNLVQGSLWNQPVKSISADFHGDKDTIFTNTQINLPAGVGNAQLSYSPATLRYQAKVEAASLRLDQLQDLQRRVPAGVTGTLNLKAQGEGTIAQPQLHATLDVPQLQISGQAFSQVQVQLDVAQQHARLTLTSAFAQASAQAKGDLSLTGNYPLQANFEIRGAPLAALLARSVPGLQTGLEGSIDLNGSLDGPLKMPDQLQATLEVPNLNLAYKAVRIANVGPLRFDYRQGIMTVQRSEIKGSGSDFRFQGTIPIASEAPMDLSANGVVDVSLLQMLSRETHASGQIKVSLEARGRISDPELRGQLQVANASFESDAAPVGLSSVNGEMNVSGNQIEVKEIQGTAGGGRVVIHGSLTIGKAPHFTVDLEAQSVRIHPIGIHTTLDGRLQLNGTPEKAELTGRIVVDHLSFQKGSDLSTIIAQFADQPMESAPSAFATNTKLNVTVQSSDELNLANSQFSVAGSANLALTNTLAAPVILGRISLTGGEIFFQGKRFELRNGTVAFSNPVHTEPVLNLFVNTVVEQYNITINFLGPVDRLKTNYTSDPALPPLDIINLLAFGQTTAEQASNAATPTSLGAESVVAEGVAGQVAKGIQNLTGLSQLTLDPMAGSNQNPGAQLAVQQRVSGNLLFTFSTNVTSAQNESVQLDYQPKRQITISVLRDQYGGYGFDVKLHKVF
jgi:translocation and assembly module TamB